jgi:hypothetical protein
MTTRRFVATCAVAFVLSQILAILVHGVILRADYMPFYGNLLRPMGGGGDWRMLLLPVAHLSFVVAFVWIYSNRSRVAPTGGWMQEGLKYGLIGWMIGQAPLWLLWYAEQPWPDALVLKQLVLELISALILGVAVAAMARTASAHGASVSVRSAA